MSKKMFIILLTFTTFNIHSNLKMELETNIKTKLPQLKEEDLRKIDNEIDEIIDNHKTLEKKLDAKQEELIDLKGELYLAKLGENSKNSVEQMKAKIKKCEDEINHLKEELKKLKIN